MAKKLKWPKPDCEYEIPLYGGRVYLFKTPDKLNAALLFANSECDRDVSEFLGVTIQLDSSDGRIYYVGLFDNTYTTLVHEVCHVCLLIAEYVGIEPIESHGEPFCYLLDSMFGYLAKAITIENKNDT